MEIPDQASWDERYAGPGLLWGAEPNRFLVEAVTALPLGRAVDLGTGEGRNAIWLAERGWQVTGVDFSPAALDRAARFAAEREVNVRWVRADLLAWQPPEGGYDLVLMAYIQLPPAILSRVWRAAATAVAPGGTLLVVGHHRDNITRGYGGPPDPERLYNPAEVTAELDGLTVLRAEEVPRIVSTPEGERTAIDTLVRAERPA